MELTKEQKILQRVLSEAWNNPSFKAELMTNPEEAVKSLTGESFSLPKGKTLEICDQSNPSKVYLNIPVKPDLSNVILTDEQLEEVAGGNVPGSVVKDLFPNGFPPPSTGPTVPTS